MKNKVNFLIIGTQKGGTTALDAYLRLHPEIGMASVKEVHFFDNEDYFKSEQIDYNLYHCFFSTFSNNQKVQGEATPIYMYWEAAAQRIWDYNPHMKLIVLLRNPISRAYSHWNMERDRQAESLDFFEAIQRESERCHEILPFQHRVYSYVDRGFYTKQILRLWNLFPKNQILILKSEDLNQFPQETLNQVCQFLEISPLQNVQSQRLHSRPYLQSMSSKEKNYLQGIFYSEIKELEKMLAWDCSTWLETKTLIHIGYHKTATTWLQQKFFPRHSQLDFIGEHKDLSPLLIAPHGFDFKAKVAQEFFYPKIEQALQNNLIPVISAERLSGNPHSGGYDSKEIADRLKEVFPNSKILMMIRHQPEAILSNYKQYIKMGGICTLKEYMFPPQEGRIPLFKLENLKYHRLANYYAKLFGGENLKIIPYEKFLFHPQLFLEEMANFLGIDSTISFPFEEKVNQSLSDAAIILKRKVNRWHGNDSLFPVTPPFPKITSQLFDFIKKLDKNPLFRRYNAHFIEQIQRDIGHLYGESNRQLAEMFEVDLETYQYCLESI
jgi:hypothetical protein